MNVHTDIPRQSLWAAFAASLLVHASAGVVVGHGFDARRVLPMDAPALSVRIANAPAPQLPAPAPSTESASLERVDSPAVLAQPSEAKAAEPERALSVNAAVMAPPSGPPAAAADPNAQRFAGRVSVVPDPTLTRVGWFLENRSRSEFPVEVRRPVRLGEALRFDYPADALDTHREGVVVAWLAVDVNGSVTELNIVSGDDDFSVAVVNALAAARLLPATDLYDKPIPFYTVLEFDFQIDRVDATRGTGGTAVTVTAPPQ